MSTEKQMNGACLCGSVKFSFQLKSEKFDVCHCGMCRKWSGGPSFAVEAGSKVEFDGSDNISLFNSSDWAERGFCKNCGTHLFYRTKDKSYQNFQLGLIEGNENLKFHSQIFIDKKPENYSFSNQTENMTEAEVFAMFAGN